MSGYDEAKRYAVVGEVRWMWADAGKKVILAHVDECSVPAVARQHYFSEPGVSLEAAILGRTAAVPAPL